nr:hypothetical protein [Actinomycetota bacterium]
MYAYCPSRCQAPSSGVRSHVSSEHRQTPSTTAEGHPAPPRPVGSSRRHRAPRTAAAHQEDPTLSPPPARRADPGASSLNEPTEQRIHPLDGVDLRVRVQRGLDEHIARQRTVLAEVGAPVTDLVDAVADLLAGGKRLRAAFLYWGYRAA